MRAAMYCPKPLPRGARLSSYLGPNKAVWFLGDPANPLTNMLVRSVYFAPKASSSLAF